jgi:hypothetical protein
VTSETKQDSELKIQNNNKINKVIKTHFWQKNGHKNITAAAQRHTKGST